jgi:glycine cleavage system H protein
MTALKFTKDHEWVRLEDDIAVIGITDYAQQQLGDVVFVELPQTGAKLAQGKDAAVVESVKAASEVYAPLDGTVTAINSALEAEPSIVNTDPQGAGWFFRLKLANPAQLDGLLEQAAYDALTRDAG